MLDRVLRRIRDLVQKGRYVLTMHGFEEMQEDGLLSNDIEQCILNGEIIETQRDKNTGEMKYLVRGLDDDFRTIIVVMKIGPTGKLVIITVYIE